METGVKLTFTRRGLLRGAVGVSCSACVQTVFANHSNDLEIGVLPNVSARVLAAQYESLIGPLSVAVGRAVKVSTAPSWRDFYGRVKAGAYDVIVAAANVARVAERDLGYRSIAQYEPSIPGLLVVRKGVSQAVEPLLNGQMLAFSNPASLVAFEGLRWLEQQGLVLDQHYKAFQVRGDDSVGNVILRGEAAAGVMSGGEFRAQPDDVRAQLTVHTQFAEVAGFIVCVHPDLDKGVTERLSRTLLDLSPLTEPGKTFFERSGFKGIVPVKPGVMSAMDAYLVKTRRLID